MAGIKEFTKQVSTVLKVGSGFSLDAADAESTPGYKGKKPDGVALLAAQDGR